MLFKKFDKNNKNQNLSPMSQKYTETVSDSFQP